MLSKTPSTWRYARVGVGASLTIHSFWTLHYDRILRIISGYTGTTPLPPTFPIQYFDDVCTPVRLWALSWFYCSTLLLMQNILYRRKSASDCLLVFLEAWLETTSLVWWPQPPILYRLHDDIDAFTESWQKKAKQREDWKTMEETLPSSRIVYVEKKNVISSSPNCPNIIYSLQNSAGFTTWTLDVRRSTTWEEMGV